MLAASVLEEKMVVVPVYMDDESFRTKRLDCSSRHEQQYGPIGT